MVTRSGRVAGLPYLLGIVSAIALLSMMGQATRPQEPAPTPIAIGALPAATNEWITVTGGGVFLPATIVEAKRSRLSSTERDDAFYVPMFGPKDGEEFAASGRALFDVGGRSTWAKFTPEDFAAKFPNAKTSSDPFIPMDVTGTRAGRGDVTAQFGAYLADMKMPPENVVIIEYGRRPMTRATAIGWAGGMAVVLTGSVAWIVRRWLPRRGAQSARL